MSLEIFSLDAVRTLIQHYGYWTIFIGIALENTGIPLPGETITLAGGFLAGGDELEYVGVLLSAFSGAVLGDNFGYWLGRWQGWPFLLKVTRGFRIPEAKLEMARDRFTRNAAQAVILGRFVTLLRIFAGPLAGIAAMPYPQFLACNAIGAALWATVMVTLAFVLGQIMPLEQLIQHMAEFGLLLLAGVCLGIGGLVWQEVSSSQKSTDVLK